MNKDELYKLRHPDRVKESCRLFYNTHKDEINLKRRQSYDLKKDDISKAGKEDVRTCPLCNIDYRRVYLHAHLQNRHKVEALCPSIFHRSGSSEEIRAALQQH